MENTTIKVNVKEVIKEAITMPSIAMKLIHLEKIKNHPVSPVVIDCLAKVIDMGMKKNISDFEMEYCVNHTLQLFVEKFKK